MNEIRVTAIDTKSALISGFDERQRWRQMQIDISNRYAKYLLDLAKKGLLNMPLGALKELFAQRGVSFKMIDTDQNFLDDVIADLGDDLNAKSLARRGYDSDGEVISYKGTALWPASVLSAGDDSDVKALRREIETTLSVEYTRAFARYLNGAFKHGSKTVALTLLSDHERKALQAGNNSEGGFAVPADYVGTMLARVTATSVVRRGARVIPTVRDSLTVPAFAPHELKPSVYSSGFVGSWVPEVPLWSDDDPELQGFHVSVRKQRIGVKLSRDLVEDAGGVEWLTSNGADNLAAGEDFMFLRGANSNGEPEGILENPDIATVDIEGSTGNTISNTTGADGSGSKMQTLAGALPSQYQANAVLITASATEASVNKLVDAQRNFLYPRRRGPDGRRELLGYPVENSPHMPVEGTNGNKVVLVGDMRGYVVAPRGLITLILRERFADSDQVGVVLVDRVGGAVFNADAFRVGVV